MKNKISLLLLSISLLVFLSCTNKKSDTTLPKPVDASGANLRTGTPSDSICGNYDNLNDPNPNDKNAFCIRYFSKVDPNEPPRPLIITFHGGSYIGGDKSQFILPLTIGSRFPVLLTTQQLDNNKFAYASANYRLLDNPNNPNDDFDLSKDSLTIKSCLNDCKAFVEHIRDHATEYNIDTNKIILMGYSGGADAALWIGLQNNLIPGVTIKGIVTFNAQATMNILEWRNQVFSPGGVVSDYDQFVVPSLASAAGVANIAQWSKLYYNTTIANEINTYSNQHKLSYFSLFDSADPELYMACQAPPNDIVHHSAHTGALNLRSKAATHKSRIQFTVHPYFVNPYYESLIQFFVRKFQ